MLWRLYVAQEGIVPAREEEDFTALLAEADEGVATIKPWQTKNKNVPSPVRPKAPKQPAELDRRTDEKLRRGQMPIEGRCDLHGYNQPEAHAKLTAFIRQALSMQKRCVLVITGKGRPRVSTGTWEVPEEGVLKRKVPQWLLSPPLSADILKIYPAKPKDGGSGALYVYLKRQR
jgi:DNA-nicking Smr family endonuclease